MAKLIKVADNVDIKIRQESKMIAVDVKIEFVSSGDMESFINSDGSINRELLYQKIWDKIHHIDTIELK